MKKRYGHKTLYTLESKTLPQTASPQTVLLTGLLGKTGVVVVVVMLCVWGVGAGEEKGGNEAISKLKGAGATHALPRPYLHVSCLP